MLLVLGSSAIIRRPLRGSESGEAVQSIAACGSKSSQAVQGVH